MNALFLAISHVIWILVEWHFKAKLSALLSTYAIESENASIIGCDLFAASCSDLKDGVCDDPQGRKNAKNKWDYSLSLSNDFMKGLQALVRSHLRSREAGNSCQHALRCFRRIPFVVRLSTFISVFWNRSGTD